MRPLIFVDYALLASQINAGYALAGYAFGAVTGVALAILGTWGRGRS